jgi:CIC family chloride channel protein
MVAAAVVVARYSAIAANRIGKGRLGFSYISHAPSEEEERKGGISLGGTLMRSFGIFAVSIGASSIGREAAILETCGAIGHSIGKKLWNAGPVIASAGIAAAFAGAYHAPIGGVIYVFGHARSWRSKRSLSYAVIGAAISYSFTVHEFGNRPIFAIPIHSARNMLILGFVAFVPAIVGSRLLLELRDRAAQRHLNRLHPIASTILLVVVAAACVSLSPLTAGNGMEAIRTAAVSFTVWVGLALALTKLVAIVATIGSRAPGGVFAPTLSVSAGWALLTFLALHNLGVPLPGTYWDGMVVAMSIGVAIGLQSPLLGMVVVAEMTGQVQFIPVIAFIVLIATQLNKVVDKHVMSRTHRLPKMFQDQDA